MDEIDIDVIRDEIFQDIKDPKVKIKVAQLARKAKEALASGNEGEATKIVSSMKNAASGGSDKGPELKAPGKDLSHDKAIALKKVEDPIVAGKKEMSSIKGSIANIMKNRLAIESALPPEEFQKFQDEIAAYQEKAADLASLIKSANSVRDIRNLDNVAKNYVNYVRNTLHQKVKHAMETGEWGLPEKPAEPAQQGQEPVAAEPKSREQSRSDLQGDVDAWFADQGIDISQFGMDPDSEVPDDPEGNEIQPDQDLDQFAAREEDFASKIRSMMHESYEKSYKDATKKLI